MEEGVRSRIGERSLTGEGSVDGDGVKPSRIGDCAASHEFSTNKAKSETHGQ